MNRPVLAFAMGLSALVAIALGLITAVRAAKRDPRESLVDGARGQAGGASSQRVGRIVVAAQMAMTVVLLIGAALLGRSLLRVLAVDPGFRTDGIVAMDWRCRLRRIRRRRRGCRRSTPASSIGCAGFRESRRSPRRRAAATAAPAHRKNGAVNCRTAWLIAATVNDNRQGNRDDRAGDRRDANDNRRDDITDRRDDRRTDWQEHWDNHNWHHDDWCHGHWNGSGWGHLWDNYPVAAALGLTSLGRQLDVVPVRLLPVHEPVLRPSEPTVVYNYSEPLVVYDSPPVQAAGQPATAPESEAAADTPPPLPPGVSQAALDTFDQARDAFYQADYPQSLELVEKRCKACRKMRPFTSSGRWRCLRLGEYQEAASTIYAVLAVGPGWDWTTMSSMYPDVETYTEQLRKLEAFVKANGDSSAAHFLLAYHYITMGHNDSAIVELKKVIELTPENNVAREMLDDGRRSRRRPGSATTKPAKTNAAPPPSAMEIVGDWSASANNGKFQMTLTDDGTFTWAYDKDGKRQEVKGVYALEGNSLAMEPDSGGTMLADVSKGRNNALHFRWSAHPPGDPGLEFKR